MKQQDRGMMGHGVFFRVWLGIYLKKGIREHFEIRVVDLKCIIAVYVKQAIIHLYENRLFVLKLNPSHNNWSASVRL